ITPPAIAPPARNRTRLRRDGWPAALACNAVHQTLRRAIAATTLAASNSSPQSCSRATPRWFWPARRVAIRRPATARCRRTSGRPAWTPPGERADAPSGRISVGIGLGVGDEVEERGARDLALLRFRRQLPEVVQLPLDARDIDGGFITGRESF